MNTSVFEWLQSTGLAVSVGEVWFPYVESLHVVCLALVAGSILTVDARLLGFGASRVRVSYLSEQLLPWTWGAFAGSVVTGSLLFMANASVYVGNKPFQFKMLLLLLAGLNMLVFQFVTWKRVADWDLGPPATAARAGGLISMLLWCGVVACGRWVGFV